MVPLGLGQAILGGFYEAPMGKIYHMTCSHHDCLIVALNKDLSIPRTAFVAIPIPDSISGCISKSKFEYVNSI